MEYRGYLIREVGPKALQPLLPPNSKLSFSPSIEGRDGTGLKTRVPWIRIYDKDLSPSITKGWYVVFLFSFDGQAVYLSLNQGTTTSVRGSYIYRPKPLLQKQAIEARSKLSPSSINRLLTSIELKDPKGLGEQ